MLIKDYPKTLKIKDALWEVKFVSEIEKGGKYETLGLCDPYDQIIYIRLRQTRKERFMTFLHELVHAMDHEYKIGIPHDMVVKLERPLAELWIANYVG